MKTYFYYTVQGYERLLDDGRVIDSCIVRVIAESEERAINLAKDRVKKTFYRVSEVSEVFYPQAKDACT